MKTPENQIWAYLHGELSLNQRKTFERELEQNAALQLALQERKKTNELLKEAMADELIGEWEEEHPEFKEAPSVRRPKLVQFAVPLAAAAALVIGLMLIPSDESPMDWQKTKYGSAPQLRNQSEAKKHYSSKQLQRLDETLRSCIEEGVADTTTEWSLQIQMQEMAHGALIIEVSGQPKGATSSSEKVWSKSFSNFDESFRTIPQFGKQIASELAE